MQKTKILNKSKKLEIVGRYIFDYGEGWSIALIDSPFTVDTRKCFMCEGKGKISYLDGDGKCEVCEGTGFIEEKIYSFSKDSLADFLSNILESGDEFVVTVEVTNRKPASMWKGVLEESKDGKFLLKGDKK